ncbi:MAG: transposase [Bacillota bacterium]
MVLSMTGEIAEKFWKEIPERFPVVRLDAWIIMPNHIHGILAIEQHDGNMRRRNASGRVPTRGIHPLIPNSVSSIINHYKGNVKRYCDRNNMSYFAWQPRFHDRIIRSEPALQAIRRYIRENPARWGKDK